MILTLCTLCFDFKSVYLHCRPAEAEAALAHSLLSRSKSFDDIATEFGETAPYALALLAKVYRCVFGSFHCSNIYCDYCCFVCRSIKQRQQQITHWTFEYPRMDNCSLVDAYWFSIHDFIYFVVLAYCWNVNWDQWISLFTSLRDVNTNAYNLQENWKMPESCWMLEEVLEIQLVFMVIVRSAMWFR